MILSNIDKREIGLKLFKSCVEPPLCSGITFTMLSFSGKIPLEKDMLMIWHQGNTIKSATVWRRFRGILDGSVDLLFKDLIISSTSLDVCNY